MTDAELRDAAVKALKLTTVGYVNPRWTVPPPGTQWQIALDYLKQIGQTAPPSNFTKTLHAGGDVNVFLDSLKPGDRAGIEPGSYTLNPSGRTNAGTQSQPVLVGSTDPANPARINGRLDLRGSFAWWTFDQLVFRDNTALFTSYEVSWVLGGNHIVFRRCDFSNGNTKIGMEQINDPVYGVGADNLIDRCRFHQIGRHPCGSTNNDHGLYDVGYRLHVIDSIFDDCADRGIQIRGAHDALYEYVTVSGCGEGVIFGDLGATNCTVRRAILANNKVASRFLIEEYDPNALDTGNRVEDTFAWNTDGRPPVGPTRSVTFTGLQKTDPQLDAALMPKPGSVAAGYGCRVALPIVA